MIKKCCKPSLMLGLGRSYVRYLWFKGVFYVQSVRDSRRPKYCLNRFLIFVLLFFLVVPRLPYLVEFIEYGVWMVLLLSPFYLLVGKYR